MFGQGQDSKRLEYMMDQARRARAVAGGDGAGNPRADEPIEAYDPHLRHARRALLFSVPGVLCLPGVISMLALPPLLAFWRQPGPASGRARLHALAATALVAVGLAIFLALAARVITRLVGAS